MLPPPAEGLLGPLAADVIQMAEGAQWPGQKRPIWLAFLTIGGAAELGDIDAAGLAAILAPSPQPPTTMVYGLCDQRHLSHRNWYSDEPVRLAAIPQSYRSLTRAREAVRADLTFAWARANPARAQWAESLTAHLASLPNRMNLRVELSSYNALLDYVGDTAGLPVEPLEYCRRGWTPPVSIDAYLDRTAQQGLKTRVTLLRQVSRYFDWLLDTQATSEDGVLDPAYRNPLPESQLPPHPPQRGQTYRNAIPARYLRMMREILEDDDFAWARTIESDYFLWRNPATGATERTWSPVRAMFYLLRLILPIRGLQARLLDSGEGDRMVYRPSTNDDTDPGNTTDHWVPNTGPYATRPGDRRPDQGFLRRIWDGDTGRHFTGLYITTNKTQDRESLFTESGYEIPWENPDIVALFTRLRDWQERYNPSTGGLSRAMLSDPHLAVSADVAARLPRLHFLFRDAASPTTPQEPPTTGRTGVFWHLLVNELERRLAAQGERNDDGTPIRLITKKSETGYPSGTVFDPHSLRVSGLTALAGAGVPIHILSQFVAGHATVLMTLYYQKPGAAEITRILDAAVADVAEGEQRDWDRHLKSRPLELLHDIAAYNDPSALTGARETQSSLWAPMDDGICPNAGSRCSEGGPVINIGKGIHAPVPGGPRNCAMCRFFVTGPAFLGGLVARFNSTAGRIRESLGRLQETEARRRELTTARAAAATAGQPWAGQRDMARAEEAIATTQQELELLSQTWMAQLRLIKRSEAILAEGHQRALGQRHGAALATPETKTPPMPAGTVSPEGAKKGKGGARGAQAGSGQGSATGHDSATGPGGGRSHPGGAKAPNDAAGEGQNGDEIRNALVLNGSGADLLVALEECSEFALWDRICQSSEFYPGVDARLPAIRRARLFDAVFAREGLPAVYATLSDDQILAIGNAMSRLLHTRVSQSEADALTRGETTLERLGLTASDLLPPETPLPGPLTLTPAAVRRQLPPLTMS